MSATQTTTNYGLPIFIETDKPAWLVDFNGAMRAIDTQMKVNADAIATKSPILTFQDTNTIDFTQTGSNITADVSNDLIGQIQRSLVKPAVPPANESLVSLKNDNTQGSLAIGTGLQIANNALNAIDLNIVNFEDSTTLTGDGVTVSSANMHLATNVSKTIGKIYGVFTVEKNTSGSEYVDIDTGFTIPNTSGSTITLTNGGLSNDINQYRMANPSIRITTTGQVFVRVMAYGNSSTYVRMFPCLYFFSNFGDE